MVKGLGQHLINDPQCHRINMAERIDDEFSMSEFLDATIWLNNTIGPDSWYYEGMIFYFQNRDDMVMFKLRYFGADRD